MPVVHIVPTINGHTPKLASANSGVHRCSVKNSRTETLLKNSIVG